MTTPPPPPAPPSQSTRNIVNIDEVVAYLRATGIELNWIKEMGELTFQQQVEAMANTGVLLGIHGAGLANAMFMPAHSVLVEVRRGRWGLAVCGGAVV